MTDHLSEGARSAPESEPTDHMTRLTLAAAAVFSGGDDFPGCEGEMQQAYDRLNTAIADACGEIDRLRVSVSPASEPSPREPAPVADAVALAQAAHRAFTAPRLHPTKDAR